MGGKAIGGEVDGGVELEENKFGGDYVIRKGFFLIFIVFIPIDLF